ncbi:PHP domain-containing protein [Spirosoma sp. KUDC1026]|nr:PHP domain-containing protein [Spirosoma sp. KUDC1026]
MQFSHLHTQYSLLDGQADIKKVKGDNMPAVAITDHGKVCSDSRILLQLSSNAHQALF